MRLCSLVVFFNNGEIMSKEELEKLDENKISAIEKEIDEESIQSKEKKPLSEEGKRVTKKLEEMTGIKLMDDEDEKEVIHTQSDNVDNSESEKNISTYHKGVNVDNSNPNTPKDEAKGDSEVSEDKGHLQNDKLDSANMKGEKPEAQKNDENLQNVKDVDLGENDANKPLIFKCPNDLRLTLKKENGEYVIDESCCTAISLLVKNTGEIATNFSGAHSPNLVKILEKSLKRYLKELKKTLKKEYKIANDELTLSSEPLAEDKKWGK